MPDIKFKPLSIEEEKNLCNKTSTPYLIKLLSKNKSLFCLGIKHSGDFSEPQFETLKELIKNTEVILVESSDISKESNNEISFILSETHHNPQIVACDMNLLKAIILASKKFAKKDILLIRALVYFNKPERKPNLKEHILPFMELVSKEDFFSEIYQSLNLNEETLLDILKDYILKNNNKRIDELTSKDSLYPSPVENKTPLNNLAREISYIRDAFMLKHLNEALNKFNSILYILGKNHIIRQEKTIREIFKQYIIKCNNL